MQELKTVKICSMKALRQMLRSGEVDTDRSFAIISSSWPLDLPEDTGLRLHYECYDDLDYEVLGRTLTPEAAGRIARAVLENSSTVQTWIFTCDSGLRRSAGVACACCRYWGMAREEKMIWGSAAYEPNPLVYELLCRQLKPVDALTLDLNIYTNRQAIKETMRRK